VWPPGDDGRVACARMGGVAEDDSTTELITRARRLLDDLNMTTLGWQMPSDRIIEDFAAGEHRLLAREHAITDVDADGAHSGTRRAFSLYAPGADAASGAAVALLVEPGGPGRWQLFVAG
jgi:hypothetical protein